MKIAFVWWFDKAEWVYPNWRDGLRAALEIIGKKHQLDWYIGKKLPTKKYDFLLFWDDSNSEMFNHLDLASRTGIDLTTNPWNIENLKKVDVVFCDSQVVRAEALQHGIKAIQAFGTDSDFFTPDPSVKKDIEYFFPATFSPWKRQSEIAYLGKKLTCVGTIQPDGWGEVAACRANGVNILEGYFPAEVIRDFYRRAKRVIIPSVHGSERTVLEAMSCGIVPEITHPIENAKAASFIIEYIQSGLKNPREFILKNYSHRIYAKTLLKEIETKRT